MSLPLREQETDWTRFHKSISRGQSPDEGPEQLHSSDRLTSITLTGWTGFGRTRVYDGPETPDKQTHNRLLLMSEEMQDCLHGFISLLSWQRAPRFHIICSHLAQLLVTLWQHRPRPATNEYISCASTGIMLTHQSAGICLLEHIWKHLETSRTSVTPRRSFHEWIHSHAVWSQSRLLGGHCTGAHRPAASQQSQVMPDVRLSHCVLSYSTYPVPIDESVTAWSV